MMNTLAEHIIVARAENRPPMIEKSMYDSWESCIRLFMKGKKHGRMMLDSIDNGPLVYPTVEENRQTRLNKYSELPEAQQLQDDCDVQATDIILHGLPPDVYALVNHQEAAKDIWDRVKMLMKGIELSYQECGCRFLTVPMFQQGEYLTECINKAMAFLYAVASTFPPLNNQLRTSSNPRNQATIRDSRLVHQEEKKEKLKCTQPKRPRNDAWFNEKLMLAEAQEADELDAYDSDCDDLSLAKAVLMANLLSCDLEVLSEVPYFDSYLNDMIKKDVQEMQYSEQTHADDFQDNKIHNGSNIIPYSQYLQESQDAII
ncbi:hypothetical protein Tco_1140045 [Tanacetum coccineum]